VLDAMTAGATRGVVIAANIGACLICFLAVQVCVCVSVCLSVHEGKTQECNRSARVRSRRCMPWSAGVLGFRL
jgi:hypothetical protein